MGQHDWYRRSYRRSLIDMHISDWDEKFLFEFSPEGYVDYLKRAKIQTAMIYAQSHLGLAYFPSEVGPVHNAFRGDKRENLMKRTVELCHREGISVVSYYSLIYNTWAEETHPDWRMQITPNGQSLHQRGDYRYGLCCPNNPEYRKFAVTQIAELLDFITPEGIFFDMTFWPYMCQCQQCRKRWSEESGNESFPAENWHSPEWRSYITARERWMGEFAHLMSNAAKKLQPGITTEHNLASAMTPDWRRCVDENVGNASDYCGGDLYGDLYSHSFAAKYYRDASRNQPFEYMTSRCDADLYQHTVTKSEKRLTAEVLLTAMHHGASLIIDAIEPDGTLDTRTAEKIGRVYERQIPYERYFTGEPVGDVAVYYSVKGKYDPDGIGVNHACTSESAVRRLIENHIQVRVIGKNRIDELSRYSTVILSLPVGLDERELRAFAEYVRSGGRLYFSGACETELIRIFLGGTVSGFTESSIVYFSPNEVGRPLFGEFSEKYPLQVNHRVPELTGCEDDAVIARVNVPIGAPKKTPFVSIHTSPPDRITEYPAVILKKYGNGSVLWSASPIENDGRSAVNEVFKSFINLLLPVNQRTVSADFPKTVETTVFRTENSYIINVLDYLSADDERILPPAKISIMTALSPCSVKRLSDGKELRFDYDAENRRTTFVTEKFSVFDMYGVFFGIDKF